MLISIYVLATSFLLFNPSHPTCTYYSYEADPEEDSGTGVVGRYNQTLICVYGQMVLHRTVPACTVPSVSKVSSHNSLILVTSMSPALSPPSSFGRPPISHNVVTFDIRKLVNLTLYLTFLRLVCKIQCLSCCQT